MIQLYRGDCLIEMGQIADGSVDLILCDLPYGTTQNKWDAVIPFEPLWAQYRRVLKKNGVVALTASQPFSSALVMSNPREFKYEWVWRKSRATGHLNAKRMPMKEHETVLVFSSGTHTYQPQGLQAYGKMTKRGHNGGNFGASGTENLQEFTGYPRSVLEIPSEGSPTHPTQKPVSLMEYLIRTYTHPGETVLDNCMGSGTTGVACLRSGRKFIGIEQDETHFTNAEKRIRETEVSPSA